MKIRADIIKIFKSAKVIWELCWKCSKCYFILLIPVIIINAAAPFISILFPRWIINSVTDKQDASTVIQLTMAMFALRLLSSVLSKALRHLQDLELDKIMNRLRLNIIRKTMEIKYEYLEKSVYLDMKEKALRCVEDRGNIVTVLNTLPMLLSTMMQMLGLAWIIQKVNLLIIILMLITVSFNTFLKSIEAKKSKELRSRFTSLTRKLFSMIDITWDYKYAKDIRVFGLKNWLNEKKQVLHETFSNSLVEEFQFASKTASARHVLNVLQYGIFYIWVIWRFFRDHFSIGDFSMYLSTIHNFASCIDAVMNNYVSLAKASDYIQDYMEYMYLEEMSAEGTEPIGNGTIEFQNVSFRYPDSSQYVLKNVSFTLKKGEKLSIVGDNGAGKTTLIKLMLRLYTPTSGRITINGIDVNSIKYSEYTKLFSIVFQDYKLFAFSAAENIGYDHVDTENTFVALNKVGLGTKIDALPEGLDTCVSKEFSRNGIEFSGGEQQKLVIARALYKDADIIILDEPTSNLSPMAEYELYWDFDNISAGKTVIYISHRMSSCRLCDCVMLLQDGAILEYGPHDQLLKLNGTYKKLYEVQAKYYEETGTPCGTPLPPLRNNSITL